jgi:Tfp pilus assembly protein PilF
MKKYLVLMAAVLFLVCGCSTKSESMFKKAVKLNMNGDTNGALRMYNNILRNEPDYFPAIVNRAILYEKMGELKMAEADYLKAYGMDSNQPDLLNNMGAFFTSTGRPLTGSYYLDRAIELRPDYYVAYLNRAAALSAQERYKEAVEDLNQALIIYPDSLAAKEERAMVNYRRLYYNEAINDLTEVLYYQPYNAKNYYRRGMVEKAGGYYANALEDFTMAIRLNPQYIEALYERAQLHFKNVDHNSAISDVSTIKSITDSFAPAYEFAGDIYAIEDPVEAVANYLAAKRINPAGARRYNAKIALMRTDEGRRRVVTRTYFE